MILLIIHIQFKIGAPYKEWGSKKLGERKNMQDKRRDKKGRLLKANEYQRENGIYEYKFTDADGIRRSVYSWRLTQADSIPSGKRLDQPLRDKEREIEQKLNEGILFSNTKICMNILFSTYMEIKHFANSTAENYKYMWHRFVEKTLGKKPLNRLRKSDILTFYSAQRKNGLADGTIQMLHKMIHPVLQMAVEDHLIKENPSDGCCREYTEPLHTKVALTKEEVEIFMNCVKKYHSRQRYDLLFRILLGTACRIGEVVGLTWNDVDMDQRILRIDHVMLYRKKDGKTQFYVKETKTKSGIRIIPMTKDVYNCFCELKELNFHSAVIVDGYKDFVFTSLNGKPLYPASINNVLYKIVGRYNATAEENKLPPISNHIFRHTGCTRMAEAEVDINTLQYIMGHRNPKMILKVYDHVSLERVRTQMEKLDT